MHSDTNFQAVLIADCGVESTRVVLVDLIDGDLYRLIGQHELPSTVEPPYSDVTVAIQQAIAGLELSTGRKLLEDGRLLIPQGRDGQGLDAFVVTCSAGGSLPVMVLAVTADITAQSAIRAVERTYAIPFRVVTMDELLRDNPLSGDHGEDGGDLWWKVLERLSPGGVLMVGGIDGGNIAPLRTLARVLAEALPPRPTRLEQEVSRPPMPVVYAGNSRAQEVVQKHLADRVQLRVVDNIRPQLREERISPAYQEIATLYEEQVLQRIAGYEELASWAQSPVQAPYMGLQLVARFLAAHHQRQVLAVDLGSGATSMVWAEEEQSRRVVLGHFGMGYGIGRVLARRGVAAIRRWLPFNASEEEVRDWVLNQALRPRTVPSTVRDHLLQQAVAREALAEAVEKLRVQAPLGFELVVATGGGLARAPRWTQVVQVLLDALEPTSDNPAGLVDLYLDRNCLVPSIGALATVNPDAAACVLLRDGLFHLGPCLIPLGKGRKGSKALQLELLFEDEMRQMVEVSWGELVCIPFRWGKAAHLTIKPARGTRIGPRKASERLTTVGGEKIHGGALGLIVDTRGRPLELPQDEDVSTRWMREGLNRFGAFTTEELDSVLPVQPDEEKEEESVEELGFEE